MNEFFQDFFDTLIEYLPNALGAIGILIGGWLVALIGAAITRGVLRRTRIDTRIAGLLRSKEEAEAAQVEVGRWAGRIVFYLIMLFVLVGFLQALNLTVVAQPINEFLNQVLSYLLNILGALILLLIAWIIATALKYFVIRVMTMAKLDERLSTQADVETPEEFSLGQTVGGVVYWLIFLLFLPAVLGALGLEGLLHPVQGMVDEILGVLPNILGAGLILLVGWVAARIVRQILTNFLEGIGTDRLSDQTGVSGALGEQSLSGLIGTVVYVLFLIPVVISALNTLQIEAISVPASEMLSTILTAIPAIFGAMLLIAVAYFVAKLVGAFVTNILRGIGFNKVLSWIGIGGEIEDGRRTPSEIAGYLVVVAIMIFSVIEAANLLGFTILAELVSEFLVAAGGVLLGLVIFGLGLYFGRLADKVIRDAGGGQANLLAPVAKISIVVFASALALRQTGIAEDIVVIAFGLILGTLAVSVALAVGLGTKDIAAREVDGWLKSLKGERGSE